MAKLKRSFVTISGKIDDNIYVDSKYGHHVRKAPKAGTRKHEPPFSEQFKRTSLLNKLAGEINAVLRIYAGAFKSADLYQQMLKRLRQEPLDNRFLLLCRLKGLEINEKYPLNKPGGQQIAVKDSKGKIRVSLTVITHPGKGKYHANCYYNEVLLLTWAKNKRPPTHSSQLSDWIRLSDGQKEFEFWFPKPAGTVNWLVCLQQRLGVNEKEIGAFKAEAMQVVEVGTFDKKEIVLLEKVEAERSAALVASTGTRFVVERERVKAKKE